jgi:Phosphopantetheine attachment site
MVRGARAAIGSCAIGHLREQPLRSALPAMSGYVVLHSLVAGAIEPEQKTRWQTVAKPNSEQALSRQLDAHIRARLPEYMAPRGYIVLDALPLNANNKVDRSALPAPGQDMQSVRDYEAPQGERERLIAQIWRELLGLDRVGRHDNFFALGGNSVLIVQMFGRLSAQVAVELNVADLFAHVTVADLAAHLDRADAQPAAQTDNEADRRAAMRRQARSRDRRTSTETEWT